MSRSVFDVAVLPVVGNNKGQRWWIVFIVVTVHNSSVWDSVVASVNFELMV